MTITKTNKDYIVSFSFHAGMIEDIKAIPGRWYDRNSKLWHVPIEESEAIDRFRNKYHYLAASSGVGAEDYGEIPELPDLDFDVPLKRNLFAYQRKGVAYSLAKRRLIMGDEPGLGKTGQAIATIHGGSIIGEQTFPCLVICPTSLKENWAREWSLWTDRKAIVMRDSMRNTWHQYLRTGLADVLIVNYESLKTYFVAEINIPKGEPLKLKYVKFKDSINLFNSLIIDEFHKVKDPDTAQAKFTKGIAQGKKWVLGLTGTPVVNSPRDLKSQLSILGRLEEFGGNTFFEKNYCNKKYATKDKLKQLHYKLATTCFYKRLKKDVKKDLPDKIRQIILCDITTRKEYEDALKDLAGYLKEYKSKTDPEVERSMRGEIMVKIGICKNISARGKLNEVVEFVNEIIEAGEKIVIFIHQKEIAAALLKVYPQALTIVGDDPMDKREANKQRFQECKKCKIRLENHGSADHEFVPSDSRIIICNLKTGGVGHTLTAASRVAFVEFPWHAADADQCEDRCHRISQKDSVQCIYFMGANTIDVELYKIIEQKREVANTITGSQDDVQKEIIDRIAESLFNTKALA